MKKLKFKNLIKNLLVSIVLLFSVISMSGQQVLLLKKPGKIKYYTYRIGDDIIFKTQKHNTKVYGIIYRITDTSMVVNGKYEVLLNDIVKIYRDRWGVRFLQQITRYAGLGYFGLDVLNRAINGQGPIVQKQTLIIAISLVGFSYALYPLHVRTMKINQPWILQSLDFSWN